MFLALLRPDNNHHNHFGVYPFHHGNLGGSFPLIARMHLLFVVVVLVVMRREASRPIANQTVVVDGSIAET